MSVRELGDHGGAVLDRVARGELLRPAQSPWPSCPLDRHAVRTSGWPEDIDELLVRPVQQPDAL